MMSNWKAFENSQVPGGYNDHVFVRVRLCGVSLSCVPVLVNFELCGRLGILQVTPSHALTCCGAATQDGAAGRPLSSAHAARRG